jgi:4-amino-4-deoxy-L-arabinose transferase-like glycosyltransferase
LTRGQRIAALVAWPYRYWIGLYAAMGLATLAKGPAGIVLPGGVMGLYLLVASADGRTDSDLTRKSTWVRRAGRLLSGTMEVLSPRAISAAVWQLRPFTAMAVVALIALPWYVTVGVQTSGDWLVGFFGHHNVARFAQPLEGHSGPFFYYVIAIMIGFFPWSIFLTLMILDAAKQLREDRNRMATLLVICWTVAYLGFFSVARTKLPNYVLPAYPALALMAAAFMHNWIRDPESASRRLVRWGLGSLPVVGLLLAVALPVVAHYLLPGEAALVLVGLVLLVGGGAAFWLAESQRTAGAARCLGLTAVAFIMMLFGFGADRVSQHMTSRPMAEKLASINGEVSQLATFGFFEPSLVFYHAAPVTRCQSSNEINAMLETPTSTFVVVTDDRVGEIDAVARGTLVEIHRQRRFLRPGELVLLGPPEAAAENALVTK